MPRNARGKSVRSDDFASPTVRLIHADPPPATQHHFANRVGGGIERHVEYRPSGNRVNRNSDHDYLFCDCVDKTVTRAGNQMFARRRQLEPSLAANAAERNLQNASNAWRAAEVTVETAKIEITFRLLPVDLARINIPEAFSNPQQYPIHNLRSPG